MAPNPTAVAATASIGEDRREEEHMLVTDREQEEEVPTTSSASSEIPPRPPVTPPQPVTPGPAEQADTGAEVLAVVVETTSIHSEQLLMNMPYLREAIALIAHPQLAMTKSAFTELDEHIESF
ncbi:hypothetical protein SKAU_G00269290 [Synaphobranchus kaupii]|uniref:Uncharacterized protein n=1 Tax=Synaphobranchus kaupii TaxID=118154 RepID=A0A9Q1EZX5_SYNKA|nr:hypothetical protein SKAU_G00269290 [Synaphobranchus kaupii]